MRRLFHIFVAIIAAAATSACNKQADSGDAGPVDATFSVSIGQKTKAFADGSKVDKLYVGIYALGENNSFTWVADNSDSPASVSGGKATVTFNGKIVKGLSYKVVFWAQKEGAPYIIDWSKTVKTGPVVKALTEGNANDESRDAFYGVYDTGVVTGNIDQKSIVLKRPFAQINLLVPKDNITEQSASVSSSMNIAQAPTVLNLATSATSLPADWSLSAASIDEPAFGSYASTHKYMAMNYVLVDQSDTPSLYDLKVSVLAGVQSCNDLSIPNVPLKANTRTNIIGSIFEDKLDLTISVGINSGFDNEGQIPDDSKVLTFDFNEYIGGWPAKKADAAEGEYTYNIKGEDYFFTHTKAGNGIYTAVYNNSGYLMISQDNSLGLPAINGFKLTKVAATNSAGCSTSVEVLVTSDTSGNAVRGGEALKWETTSTEYTYTLSNTKVATRYYLSATKKNAQIVKLVLTYKPNK